MNRILNKLVKSYAGFHHKRIRQMRADGIEVQQICFRKIMKESGDNQYLKKFGISSNSDVHLFKNQVPIITYETISPYIKKMMKGEKNILCPGVVKWFSKSSGTTGDQSKYIPVKPSFMSQCYTTSNWDVVGLMYNYDPSLQIFANKNLIMGGTLETLDEYPDSIVGDVSAILLENMPGFAKLCYTPDFETALLSNWDEKLDRMVRICAQENVVLMAGVPTWFLVLLMKLLKEKQAENMFDIWPDARLYLHGGVGFEPYRKEFQKLFPSPDFLYIECYNASEGYFAVQDQFDKEGMLLLLNNAVYYEFIPFEELQKEEPDICDLNQVELGEKYEMVISTSSGLWRYRLGDLVEFTSIHPFRIKVVGRTKQYLNVFGEELMIHNTDRAIANVCEKSNVEIKEYTVAPIFMNENSKGGHEWLIEFSKQPDDASQFSVLLDQEIQKLNSDYQAKRYGDIAMDIPLVRILPEGTFESWQRSVGKYGGQSKIPRLSNERFFLEEILKFSNDL